MSRSVFFLRGSHRKSTRKLINFVLYLTPEALSYLLPQGFGSFSRSCIRNGGPPAPYSANTSSRCSAPGIMWGSGAPCIVDGIESPCSVSSVGLVRSCGKLSLAAINGKRPDVAYTTSMVDTSECSRQPWAGQLGCPGHDTIRGTRVKQS